MTDKFFLSIFTGKTKSRSWSLILTVSLRGKLSVSMSAAQPLCGPRKVFYETTIWKPNLSFYRNTNQISSLPAKPIIDKAHNTSCCLIKFLPKPVRCTVKSFLCYWYQIHKIHNAASWLCQSWSLVVAKGRRGAGDDGCVGRIESVDVLHTIKHLASFWEDQLLLLMNAAQRKERKDNSQPMEWFESTQEVESDNDSGNCIFFFSFFQLWYSADCENRTLMLIPPGGRGWGEGEVCYSVWIGDEL